MPPKLAQCNRIKHAAMPKVHREEKGTCRQLQEAGNLSSCKAGGMDVHIGRACQNSIGRVIGRVTLSKQPNNTAVKTVTDYINASKRSMSPQVRPISSPLTIPFNESGWLPMALGIEQSCECSSSGFIAPAVEEGGIVAAGLGHVKGQGV